MQITCHRVDWEFSSPFRIAYRTRTHAQTVVVEVSDAEMVGRGEALGVSYHGENAELLLGQIRALSSAASTISRSTLPELLPAGGARNALDCALWDLEAKLLGRRAWQLAGLESARPLLTAYTLTLDTPEATARAALGARQYSLLKLKLNGEDDLARVSSVRAARPDVEIIVDANQAWTLRQVYELTPRFAELGVKLIEQPVPAGADAELTGFVSPVPLCADESCQDSASLAALIGKYEYINIKLDKTGGLTEALRLAHAARDAGFKIMVGCMGGSSLSMAPAFVAGQFADVVDLDGPLLAKSDVPYAIRYDGSRMHAPEARLWG